MSDQNLRSKLIRLAHAKPELRPHLLPMLTGKVAGDDDLGTLAEDKEAKQMHNVKPEKSKGLTTKLDPQRDPYARSLQQGQFKPKTIPDKRHKDPKHKPQWGKEATDKEAGVLDKGDHTSMSDSIDEVVKRCKVLKAETKNPKEKKKIDDILKALSEADKTLDDLFDME